MSKNRFEKTQRKTQCGIVNNDKTKLLFYMVKDGNLWSLTIQNSDRKSTFFKNNLVYFISMVSILQSLYFN